MANETSKRDVNAEFAASKAQQIASAANPNTFLEDMIAEGKVNYLGANRYRVTEGWDVGEVFTYVPVVEGEVNGNVARIVGEHGLDIKSDGTVAAYMKDHPAWWDLEGTSVIKGGFTSVKNVLDMTGLNWETLVTPQEGTNPVTGGRDVYMGSYRDAKTGEILQRPVGYHTRRGDTGAILGAVGKVYTPIHNHQAYGFLDELFGDRLMVCESAGSFRDGAKTFFTAELPEDMVIDPGGFADHIKQYLAIVNTHDGSGLFRAMITPWRIVCKNTERFAVNGASTTFSIRHTKRAMSKVETAKRTLGLTTQYYAEWAKEETALVQVDFHENQINALCDQVWDPTPADAGRDKVRNDTKRRDTVRELFKMEAERCGSNAYAAERAVTGYLDHYAELRPRGVLKGNRLAASAVSILEGTADEPKNRAHRKLMMLTNKNR